MGIFPGKGRETSPDFQGIWRRAEVQSSHLKPSAALNLSAAPLKPRTRRWSRYGFGVAAGSQRTTTGTQSVVLPKREITELKVGERGTSNPERTHSRSTLTCADFPPHALELTRGHAACTLPGRDSAAGLLPRDVPARTMKETIPHPCSSAPATNGAFLATLAC